MCDRIYLKTPVCGISGRYIILVCVYILLIETKNIKYSDLNISFYNIDNMVLLQDSLNFPLVKYSVVFSLTGLQPSVVLSKNIGDGVPYPISGHIEVRIHHYIIFINTGSLFLIHLQLVRPPPLILEPYTLLLPPAHYCWGSWPPLICHFNVKNWPHINVLGHTVLKAGDVLPNSPYPCVLQHLTNGGVLPLSVLAPRHMAINQLHCPIMQDP